MQWRPAPGFPDYEVTANGQVRRSPNSWGRSAGRTRKLQTLKDGRIDIHLRRDGQYVHARVSRLVCEVWNGPPPPGAFCCHCDGDPTNNHWSNLRWDTHASNMADKIVHGTNSAGQKNHQAKLTTEQVAEIRRRYSVGDVLMRELGEEFGVGRQAIGKIVRGVRWLAR